jgi:hypothetical protein
LRSKIARQARGVKVPGKMLLMVSRDIQRFQPHFTVPLTKVTRWWSTGTGDQDIDVSIRRQNARASLCGGDIGCVIAAMRSAASAFRREAASCDGPLARDTINTFTPSAAKARAHA